MFPSFMVKNPASRVLVGLGIVPGAESVWGGGVGVLGGAQNSNRAHM